MPRPAPELQPRLRFPHAGTDAFGPLTAEPRRRIAPSGKWGARWACMFEIVTLSGKP